MRNFYYVHTGHRIGLDRFRRACTIIRELGDMDITLLCSDFRIAQIAKDFGVKNAVGIDVVRNIPQIAFHGDKLIFDSDEANPIMLEDMQKFFSTFIHVEEAQPIIDKKYFTQKEKTIELSYFFGDDDYSKDLQKNFDMVKDLEPDLLLGFYYFLDYEDMLKSKFKNSHEFEDYDDVIQKSKILITASPQAVLESLASGAKPIYIQRADYTQSFNTLFKSLNIPIVNDYNKEQLSKIVANIDNHKYEKINQNGNILIDFIKENLN